MAGEAVRTRKKDLKEFVRMFNGRGGGGVDQMVKGVAVRTMRLLGTGLKEKRGV